MYPIDKELKSKMFIPLKNTDFVRRGLTLAVALTVISGGSVAMSAQSKVNAPVVDFKSYSAPNLALANDDAATGVSSSSAVSSDDQASVVNVDPLHLNAMQYERRRYGKPRYRGNNTNADGSDKYIFYGGGGFTQPVGNTWKYFTPSWGVQVGGGRQFSNKFAVPVEFDYDNFGLTGQTINNQLTLYNNQINYYCNQNPATCAADGVSPFTSLDGNAHVWSFSVDPTFTFLNAGHDGVGAYLLVGAGFYHKVTNFTTPTTEEYCDYYYGCGDYTANAVVDHYTSNAPGFNGGLGFTYKVSHFSNVKLYAEGRYVFVVNSQRTGVTVNSPVNNATVNATNDFPQNSNRTSYFPIKFGIRF